MKLVFLVAAVETGDHVSYHPCEFGKQSVLEKTLAVSNLKPFLWTGGETLEEALSTAKEQVAESKRVKRSNSKHNHRRTGRTK